MTERFLLDGHRCIETGNGHFLIESRTHPEIWYSIELVDEGKGYLVEHCTCDAFEHRKPDQELPCWHTRLFREWRLGKADFRLDVETLVGS